MRCGLIYSLGGWGCIILGWLNKGNDLASLTLMALALVFFHFGMLERIIDAIKEKSNVGNPDNSENQ